MLVLSRKKDERIFITIGGRRLVLTIVDVDRGKIRLGFEGGPEFVIQREELATREAVPLKPVCRPIPEAPA